MTVSQGEKIVVILLAVITLGLVLGVFTRNSVSGDLSLGDNSVQIVEPGIVKVALRMFYSKAGIMEPALLLEAETGARCEKVSSLILSSYTAKDIFYIDIGSYALKPVENKNCDDDFQLAEALIPITSILDDGVKKKDTKIILRDSTNNYRLSRDEYAVYLEPLETINAVPDLDGSGDENKIVVCLKKTSSPQAPKECRSDI